MFGRRGLRGHTARGRDAHEHGASTGPGRAAGCAGRVAAYRRRGGAGAGAVQVRARPGGHRRHHRSARRHHLRQRQVLRRSRKYRREELLGQDHRIINSGFTRRSSSATCGGRSRRGRSGAARSATGPRTARSTGWTRRSCRCSTSAGKPRQYLAIRYDITERKAVEAQLREQAALAQLGEMAAIVAHEVRNPLAGLRGSLQILATRLPPEMRERQIVGAMVDRIDALNERVHDILLVRRLGQGQDPAGDARRPSSPT